MAGPHSHGHVSEPTSDVVSGVGVRRALAVVAALLAVATGAAMWALWPRGDGRTDAARLGLVSDVYEAKVLAVERRPCAGTEGSGLVECDAVEVRLTQGPHDGETRELEFPLAVTTPRLAAGDEVVLGYDAEAPEGFEYQFSDRQRRLPILLLVGLFALAVVLLGRLRGLAALVGLGLSIVVLLQFVIPAVLDGRSPVLVAVVGGAAIAYLALYLAHGLTTMTTVALLGTLAALGCVMAISALFVELAQFSGFASEEASLVALGSAQISISGLLLGGILIGAMGAIDDITVTQASAVWELRAADPAMPRRRIFGAGMRIGRDHVASTVNTLVLAYAGASLPLLVLFVQSRQSLGSVANSEVISVEIVRALAGSIGLVAAVPLTTWLATLAVRAPRPASVPRLSDDGDDLGAHEDDDGGAPLDAEARVGLVAARPGTADPPRDGTDERRRRLRLRRRKRPPPSDEEVFWSSRRRSP